MSTLPNNNFKINGAQRRKQEIVTKKKQKTNECLKEIVESNLPDIQEQKRDVSWLKNKKKTSQR